MITNSASSDLDMAPQWFNVWQRKDGSQFISRYGYFSKHQALDYRNPNWRKVGLIKATPKKPFDLWLIRA